MKEIMKLACCNPDWKSNAKTLISTGKTGDRIFRYNFINKPVKLISEPKNKYDKNAIIVQIAGEKVGYIGKDENIHVLSVIKKRRVKFVSAFIFGGEYKVVSENGNINKDENDIEVRIKIGYQ